VLIPVTLGARIVEIPTISSRKKVYWDMARARAESMIQAGPLMGSLVISKLYDSPYYLAPNEDILRIVEAARIDQLQYVEEISDCDDFHRKLVTAFLNDAYREIDGKKVRRPPYLFGIAESAGHAFNFYFAEDGLLRFLEPQTSEVFMPAQMRECVVEMAA